MLNADRETLNDKLIDLMVMRTTQEDGSPYVRADGTFGLYCGNVRGGLYSAYHLIDGLKLGGLFDAPQAPRTDLDTAVYELTRENVFRPFPEVKLFWNEMGQLQVEVKTEKPLTDILDALDAATKHAKANVRQRFNEKAKWQDDALTDYHRDRMGTVFGPAVDAAFFQAYMRYRFEKDLDVTGIAMTEEPLDDNSKKMLQDERPRHVCMFDAHRDAPMHPSDFVSDLGKTFTGKVAVMMFQSQPGFDDLRLQIAGTAARLTADILDNDSAGARKAANILRATFAPDVMKKIDAEIDNRDRGLNLAQDLKEGTRSKITAMARPKFKANP